MLRGRYPAKVDEKGRLKIPASFLGDLRKSGSKFYVTSTTGDYVRIYPMKVWTDIEKKLAKLSTHNRAKQKFLDRANYFGQAVEIDGQGRLLIPSILRDSAVMQGDVDVLGFLTFLQVWNHNRFEEKLKGTPVTEDDEKAWDEMGI
jgi:MraZ protein